jgi:hypothetical protein
MARKQSMMSEMLKRQQQDDHNRNHDGLALPEQ